jgi:hypothetical protein
VRKPRSLMRHVFSRQSRGQARQLDPPHHQSIPFQVKSSSWIVVQFASAFTLEMSFLTKLSTVTDRMVEAVP